jgi:hypothetical protein
MAETGDLRTEHSLILHDLANSFARTRSQTMASINDSLATLQQLDAADKDAAKVDILSAPSSPTRTRSDSPHEWSPVKAALYTTPPRSAVGLARTARDPSGLASALTSPLSESSLTIDSETDLGLLVEKTAGRHDHHYAARLGVRGACSSDETSESGSFRSSGLASGSTSQTPSIYSTGSFHPHLIPNGADQPRCTSRHAMQFGRFTQGNHCCDNCSANIARSSFGWHCEVCSFDYCSGCFAHTWEPIPSEASTIQDSLSTLQLSSQSASPQAAHRQGCARGD